MISFTIKTEERNLSVEKYVKKKLEYAPLSFIYKLFRKKDIKVNGVRVDKKHILKENDEIQIYITDRQVREFIDNPQIVGKDEISPFIIYEDKDVLIVNKPRGVLVQKDDEIGKSLTDMVISYLVFKGEYDPSTTVFKPAPAHRIDRNTSGLVVFGKSVEALQYLFSLFKDKELISKHYYCLVKGVIEKDGVVDAPLYKDEKTNKVFVSKNGKKAISRYHVLSRFNNYTLLEVIILTGRTHQIRAHMAYIDHPVIGDAKYGDFSLNKEFEQKFHFKNQFLHAYRLDFGELESPLEGIKNRHFEAPLPEIEEEILQMLSLKA